MSNEVGIGAASKLAGVTTRCLRYLEQIGAISPRRTPSGRRRYDQECVEFVKKIREQRKRDHLPFRDVATLIKGWKESK